MLSCLYGIPRSFTTTSTSPARLQSHPIPRFAPLHWVPFNLGPTPPPPASSNHYHRASTRQETTVGPTPASLVVIVTATLVAITASLLVETLVAITASLK